MAVTVANLLANGVTPSTVSGGGTTIKYFPQLPGVSIGVPATKNGYVMWPGNNAANGQNLSITATGNFEVGAGGTCPAVTIGLYPVTFLGSVGTPVSTPIVSYASTLQANVGAFYPWALTCT